MISYKQCHSRVASLFISFLLILGQMGSAQIRTQDIEPPPPGADVTILGPSSRSHLGGAGNPGDLTDQNHAQALVFGDFNGDGIPDLAIGAPDAMLIVGASQRTAAGAVYIIFGRKDVPAIIDTASGQGGGVDVTILGGADGDRFGFSLTSGDINGDGIADLIAGAPGAASPSRAQAGAAFIFFGGHTFGSSPTIDMTQGNSADVVIYGSGERFGTAVATGEAGGQAGGSPAADLLVGAPGSGLDSPGAAYLIYGGSTLGSQTRVLDVSMGGADFTLRGDTRQHLGASVAIGDLNGDQAGDLFAGAPGASRPDRNDASGISLAPAASTGAVFGVLGPFAQGGSVDVTNAGAVISFYGAASGHQFGLSLSVADITGDSIADIMVGAPAVAGNWTDPQTGNIYHLSAFSGAAYVFAGKQGLDQRRFDAASGEQLTTYLGESHAWLGFAVGTGSYNVPGNADTIPDLLVGSPGGVRDTTRNVGGIGGVNVVFGGRTLGSAKTRPRSPFNPAPETEDVSILNPTGVMNADFGFAVAAGDLNGDTSGDLATALPFANASGRQQAGLVQVRFGTVKPGGIDPGPSPVSVRVLSPAGGDALHVGQQVLISWDVAGKDSVRNFDVLLSTDGGATFGSSIATGLSADQLSFMWTVPNVCAGSGRLQVVANTIAGEKVVAISNGSFSIAQRGPGVDLTKSAIGADSMLLVAAAGETFPDGAVLEISRDAAGTSYAAFSRSPKFKSGGRKLKTRGTIDGKSLDQFFPDGATRSLRLSVSPCGVTAVQVRRSGDQLQIVGGGQ